MLLMILRMQKVINIQFSPHHTCVLLLKYVLRRKKPVTLDFVLISSFVTVTLTFRTELLLPQLICSQR